MAILFWKEGVGLGNTLMTLHAARTRDKRRNDILVAPNLYVNPNINQMLLTLIKSWSTLHISLMQYPKLFFFIPLQLRSGRVKPTPYLFNMHLVYLSTKMFVRHLGFHRVIQSGNKLSLRDQVPSTTSPYALLCQISLIRLP